jgi:hypothetical protein
MVEESIDRWMSRQTLRYPAVGIERAAVLGVRCEAAISVESMSLSVSHGKSFHRHLEMKA